MAVTQESASQIIPSGKFSLRNIVKRIFFLYKKGFWKFWLIYLASLLLIKALMLGLFWSINYVQDNTFVGFSLQQSQYYIQYQEFKSVTLLDPIVSEGTFMTRSFVIYFALEVLYQALLAIPLAISILVAKNIFEKKHETIKHQISQVFALLVPLLILGVVTNLLIRLSSFVYYFPGLIIMVFMSLVYPIALEEKLNPFATIKRSYQVAREQFFHILGILVLVLLVQITILGIGKAFAYLLVYAPSTANKVLSVYDSIYVLYQYDIIQSIVYSIIAPFSAISAFVMYREAINVRNFRLSSMVESTTKLTKTSQLGASNLSINTQLKRTVLHETKTMIKENYCSNCGADVDHDSQFCDNCGKRLP